MDIRPSIDLVSDIKPGTPTGPALVTLAAIGPTVDLRPSVEIPLYAHLTIWYFLAWPAGLSPTLP